MRKIEPYRTVSGALKALDNGGRLYNLFTHAGDNVISGAELKKAAGVGGRTQNAFVYFAMAMLNLNESQKEQVLSRLNKSVREQMRGKAPDFVSPGDLIGIRPGTSCILEGYPRAVPDHTHHGSMMIPVMAGKVTTFMMIPTCDVYQVYEVFATPDGTGPNSRVMWPKAQWSPDEGEAVRFGGYIREENATTEKDSEKTPFLQPHYYTRISAR